MFNGANLRENFFFRVGVRLQIGRCSVVAGGTVLIGGRAHGDRNFGTVGQVLPMMSVLEGHHSQEPGCSTGKRGRGDLFYRRRGM